MLGLGVSLPRRVSFGRRPWTPAALFSAGQQGVWYEPRPEYLFQDAAGTVPVEADGDPVGYMQDRSGNGHHATQGIDLARPIYRTDGVLHWLQFDGVDDGLDFPFRLAATDELTIVHAFTPVGGRYVLSNWEANTGLFYQTASDGEFELFVDSNKAREMSWPKGLAAPEVLSLTRRNSDLELYFSSVLDLQASDLSLTSPDIDAALGNRADGQRAFLGDMCGLVLVDESISDNARNSTENYLAKLAGVTL